MALLLKAYDSWDDIKAQFDTGQLTIDVTGLDAITLKFFYDHILEKPFAGFRNFEDCVRHAPKSVKDKNAYCAAIMHRTEGKAATEYRCRLAEPSDFQQFRRTNCSQKHDGKCISVIWGIKTSDGKRTVKVQALRYPASDWDAASAKAHCSDRGGKFDTETADNIKPNPIIKKECWCMKTYFFNSEAELEDWFAAQMPDVAHEHVHALEQKTISDASKANAEDLASITAAIKLADAASTASVKKSLLKRAEDYLKKLTGE